MIVHIAHEKDITISENLNDKQSDLVLCSLYRIKRPRIKLHLFFNKDRLLLLAILVNDKRMRGIHFSGQIRKSMHNYLLAKSNEKIKCDFMHKWEFLKSNSIHYGISPEEELELAKLLLQKQIL